jgi:hypothetical protein
VRVTLIARLLPSVIFKNVNNLSTSSVESAVIGIGLLGNIDTDLIANLESSHHSRFNTANYCLLRSLPSLAYLSGRGYGSSQVSRRTAASPSESGVIVLLQQGNISTFLTEHLREEVLDINTT